MLTPSYPIVTKAGNTACVRLLLFSTKSLSAIINAGKVKLCNIGLPPSMLSPTIIPFEPLEAAEAYVNRGNDKEVTTAQPEMLIVAYVVNFGADTEATNGH